MKIIYIYMQKHINTLDYKKGSMKKRQKAANWYDGGRIRRGHFKFLTICLWMVFICEVPPTSTCSLNNLLYMGHKYYQIILP